MKETKRTKKQESSKKRVSLLGGVIIGFMLVFIPLQIWFVRSSVVSDSMAVKKAEELGLRTETEVLAEYGYSNEEIRAIQSARATEEQVIERENKTVLEANIAQNANSILLKDLIILGGFLVIASIILGLHHLSDKMFHA